LTYNQQPYFFLLSGENSTLPIAEFKSIIKTYDANSTIHKYNNIMFSVNGKLNLERILERGAYIKNGGILVGIYNINEFNEINNFPDIRFNTFSIKIINYSNLESSQKLVEKLDDKIKKTFPEARVNLEEPDVIFLTITYEDKLIITIKHNFSHKKEWYKRRARMRPFFHPSALTPKFSRAIINLTRIKENEVLLDPFCGTGSILIESGIININCIGIDISRKMCLGTKNNVKYFKLDDLGVINADSRYIPLKNVDGIVTDIPYGRCSSTHGLNCLQTLNIIYDNIDILKKDRYCCIVHPSNNKIESNNKLKLVEQHSIYVHRNLIRMISIMKKI
tara:strand:+ start:427 stop:1431 length:1005 start_codon:yes stop_codon:yes gene_type:complete